MHVASILPRMKCTQRRVIAYMRIIAMSDGVATSLRTICSHI